MNPDVSVVLTVRARPPVLRLRHMLLSLLLRSMGAGLLHAISMDVPVPEWREGPVRYLLTKAEDKVFKRLTT